MNALRYAALEGEMSAGPGALDETCDADFEAVVAEFGRMTADNDTKTDAQRATRTRDGSKTAAKLEARMRRRAERMALDAARHQELMDNRELRQARSLTRRWFVLGRALDTALANNPEQWELVRGLIEPHITRPDERALLGWARKPDVSQS